MFAEFCDKCSHVLLSFTITYLSSHNNLRFFLSSLQTHISIKSLRSFHDNPTLKSQSIIKTTFALLSLKSQQFALFYKISIFSIQTHISIKSLRSVRDKLIHLSSHNNCVCLSNRNISNPNTHLTPSIAEFSR